MSRWSPRFAVPLVLLSLLAPAAFGAVEPTHLDRLKRMQQQILLSEPAEKLEKLERRAEMRKKAKRARAAKPGVKADAKAGSRGKPFMRPTDLGPPPKGATSGQTTRLSGVAAPPNRRMNDHVGEPEGSCQSEVSIAAHGDNLVAAWNDGIGIYGAPFPDDTQGYAFSTDGGLNWTDGGPIPNGGQFIWSSDPVVVVNEKTGEFYFSALADPPGQSGIGVIRGTFSGGTFNWDAPVMAVSFSNTTNLVDKEWMAVDSLSGNLYVSYSNFALIGGTPVSNSIQFTRSTNQGQNWTSPVTISAGTDAGLVQGSRPAVGPAGELYVVWHAIGQSSGSSANSPFGRDFLRIRKSVDGGQSFAAHITADSVFSNFSSGAPGFNRGIGITFPGIAVDRSTGPNRGRVYLSWNESLNFYNDPFPRRGIDPERSEVENNNGSANATAFTPGEILNGTISLTGNPGDHDYWKWNANQGQTTIFYLDELAPGLDASFRVFCSNGTTLLGFSQNGFGGKALLVFTAPSTATYFIRVASYTGTATGSYSILTTVNSPQADRARDHRDLFVKSSSNGTSWGPTVRVNDSPGYFDDWLPEVQVDVKGRVFVGAYDWRDAAAICGGGSNVYLYRSDDAGANWNPGLPMTDYTTNWTLTFSTLLPNQGDYIGLHARDSTVFVAWADGRDPDAGDAKGPDPDVYMTSTTLDCQSAPVSLVGSNVTGDTVTVTWSAPQGFQANLFRRVGAGGAFVDLGVVTADGLDQIVYVDPDVGLGISITYRLGVTGFCEAFAGTVTVDIPGPPALAFGIALIRPNPTRQDVFVRPLITGSAPAYLELIDISGRQIARVDIPCQPGLFCEVNLTDGISVKPGLYFVRLVEGGREAVKRVSIFP